MFICVSSVVPEFIREWATALSCVHLHLRHRWTAAREREPPALRTLTRPFWLLTNILSLQGNYLVPESQNGSLGLFQTSIMETGTSPREQFGLQIIMWRNVNVVCRLATTSTWTVLNFRWGLTFVMTLSILLHIEWFKSYNQ